MRRIEHTNPNGSKVTVWIGNWAENGDGAEIGDWVEIGDRSTTSQPIYYVSRLGDDRDGWRITLTREHMQIGCQFHPTADWWGFDDRTISAMDRGAVRWRRKFKPVLIAMATARGWTEGMDK